MEHDVNRLIDFVAQNGYEVECATVGVSFLITILHHPTNRVSAFGFNAVTKRAALQRITEQFCTDYQTEILVKVWESE